MEIIKEEKNGLIFNIQKFSIHDGPGIRTVVFFKGCPLKCEWCSNPESQNPNLQIYWDKDSKRGYDKDYIEVMETSNLNVSNKGDIKIDHNFITKYKLEEEKLDYKYTQEGYFESIDNIVKVCLQDEMFYEESGGGVTLSGGEVLAQPEFAIELLKRLKELNIHTAIETTGYASSQILKDFTKYLDLVLIDLKHYDSKKHLSKTGVPNELIITNIQKLVKNNINFLIRIPVIPDFNSSLEDAKQFSILLNNLGIKEVQLLPFHQFGEKKYENLNMNYLYKDVKSLYEEDLEEYKNIFIENNINAFF